MWELEAIMLNYLGENETMKLLRFWKLLNFNNRFELSKTELMTTTKIKERGESDETSSQMLIKKKYSKTRFESL